MAALQRTGRDHRASPYHVAEHHPTKTESLQPHTERRSRSGSEPPSVEADVYIWRYALLVVYAGKEEVHTMLMVPQSLLQYVESLK